MTTLTDFLLARIAEDEAAARQEDAEYAHTSLLPTYDSEHQTRWNTERVLAECEAKRRIVEEAVDFVGEMDNEEMRTNDLYAFGRIQARSRSWQDHILRALAQPYSGHPDFDESWTTPE